MWLLDWLSQRWSQLYDWFGDTYWQSRNMIASIPNYIATLIATIIGYYNAAVSAIQGRINDFYNSHIVPIINWLNALIASLRQKADSLWDSFWAWVASIPDRLEQLKQSVIAWATAKYDQWIAGLKSAWDYFWNVIYPQAIIKLDSLLNFRAWLEAISNKLHPDWVDDLLASWSTVKSVGITLASNPLAFILGLLWSVAIEFLSFVIAYAMGTTKYELPAIPNWGGDKIGAGAPLPPNAGGLTRPLRTLFVSGYTFHTGHYGTDFGATRGEPVYASHDGIVTAAGWSTVGYGNYIDLSGDTWWSRYAHLQGLNVSVSQRVKAGDVIGYADSTGNSTGDHLHYELKLRGQYVDPVAYL